jgi:triosephosphate isomerase
MNRFILGSNWKMNKTVAEAMVYTGKLMQVIKEYPEFKFFILPPYTALWQMRQLITDNRSKLLLGAQNMHYENSGEFTGEISSRMLEEIGMDIVLVGHSERRLYCNENEIDINQKIRRSLACGITPVLCIGESEAVKKSNETQRIIEKQLQIALTDVTKRNIHRIWFSYEPVWAIGKKGHPADTEYVNEMHNFIRRYLEKTYGLSGKNVSILYAGSVTKDNAESYAELENVDGLIIGRNSWRMNDFEKIISAIKKTV